MKKIALIAFTIIIISAIIFFFLPKDSKDEVIPAFAPKIKQAKEDGKAPEKNADNKKDTEEKEQDGTKREDTKEQEKEKETKKDLVVEQDKIADIHIVGLGDSLTKGVGDPDKEGYIQSVAREMEKYLQEDVSVKNFGIRGYKSEQLVEKLEQDEVQKNLEQADYIFLTIGGNDILNIVEYNFFDLDLELFVKGEQDYQKNLFIIIQTIRSINPDAKIFILGLFNPFHNFFEDIKEIDLVIQEWNKTIQGVTLINENTEYIPINDIFLNTNKNLFSDDLLHPNRLGYQKISERVLLYLDIKDIVELEE